MRSHAVATSAGAPKVGTVSTTGIVATGVRRSFGSVHAVRDVSMVAEPGRITGLVGPNGSGKTTLLLMLASLLAPDAGHIRLDGVDPVAEPQRARAILGWMPDALGAWGALTARETLTVTGKLYGMRGGEASARAAVLLGEVELAELADSPARVLSRGQKQRLGLARALVHDPSVLLLDEPASGLDPQARVDLRVMLRRLAAEGRTILISSHVLAELEEIVDDAVYLVQGASVSHERVAAATAAQRTWRVRLGPLGDAVDPVAAIAAALGRDTAGVRLERGDLFMNFTGDADASAALRALVQADLPVVEFAPATGRLEQTFLGLGETL